MKHQKLFVTGMLALFFLLIIVTPKGKAKSKNQSESELHKVIVAEGADLSAFSATQQQLFGGLVGEFVLDSFIGKAKLSLPENMAALYVDNDEMYFVVRRQQFLINAIEVMGSGQIHDLNHIETVLMDIQRLSSNRFQVKAYVRLAFRYTDDPEQHQSGVGQEVVATLIRTNADSYRIESFSECSAEFSSMKKEWQNYCREANQKGENEQRKLTDLFLSSRLEELKKIRALEKAICEKQEDVEVDALSNEASSNERAASTRVSVSYNRSAAATYAMNEGTQYERIFHRVTNGGDCTNFVSQAMWVGYDGDMGDYFNWLNLYPNATYLYNCKLWAKNGHRMVSGASGWWGASKYYSTSYYPSGPWMRVWQLWSYLSTSSNGPRANKSNDGLLYTASNMVIQAGDILQFSSDPSTGYTHSVIVVNDAYQNLSGHSSIYVAQHSGDYGWRKLTDVIGSYNCYIRIIRPISGNFAE